MRSNEKFLMQEFLSKGEERADCETTGRDGGIPPSHRRTHDVFDAIEEDRDFGVRASKNGQRDGLSPDAGQHRETVYGPWGSAW